MRGDPLVFSRWDKKKRGAKDAPCFFYIYTGGFTHENRCFYIRKIQSTHYWPCNAYPKTGKGLLKKWGVRHSFLLVRLMILKETR